MKFDNFQAKSSYSFLKGEKIAVAINIKVPLNNFIINLSQHSCEKIFVYNSESSYPKNVEIWDKNKILE